MYEVNSWVVVTFGKIWYLGEVKSIGERIGRASDSFVWPENEGLGWDSYHEILRYCIINPPVPETRQVFVWPRQDLDKFYEFMLQH